MRMQCRQGSEQWLLYGSQSSQSIWALAPAASSSIEAVKRNRDLLNPFDMSFSSFLVRVREGELSERTGGNACPLPENRYRLSAGHRLRRPLRRRVRELVV